MKCFFCASPAGHPATGHYVTERVFACRDCFLHFWAWFRARLHNPLTIAGMPKDTE